MTAMTDEHHLKAALGKAPHLVVDLAHKRAGRINDSEIPCGRLFAHGRADAVRRQDRDGPLWHLVELLNEHCTALLQTFDDVTVVNDLPPDIDGCAKPIECPLHRADGPFDPSTERAGAGQEHASIGGRLAPGI